MAFSDLTMKTTSEFCLQKLHARITPITDWVHNFRDLEDKKGGVIVVPQVALSASDFNASTNNYAGGTNTYDGATITLSKHLVTSLPYTDVDVAQTEVQWARDTGIAIGDALGRAIYDYALSFLNSENITLSTANSLSSMDDFAGLIETVYDNNLDIGDTTLLVDPQYYAKLIAVLPSNVYGDGTVVKGGRIPELFGLRSVAAAPTLSATTGYKAVLCDVHSIGVGCRYLAPQPGAYVDAWKAVDSVTGLVTGLRSFTTLHDGTRHIAGEWLGGISVLRKEGLVGIV